MKSTLSTFGLAAGLLLASVAANASVTTFTFATSNKQVTQGSTYCPTYSTGTCTTPTVGVYGVQNNGTSTGTFTQLDSTLSGLFTVTDSPNAFGTGIAPFNPTEGTSSGTFSNQDGIDDSVNGGSNSNILLLKLTNFAPGSTLSLLLQAGVSGDKFNVYTSTGAMPTKLSSMTPDGSNPINVDEDGTSQPNGTSPLQPYQVTNLTIAGLTTTTTGWIAIEADCHYLLLDKLQVSTPGVPEPRFYGMLLAGLLGLAGMVYQRRRAAQVNA